MSVGINLLKCYDTWSCELNLGINIGHNNVSDLVIEITAKGNRDKPIVLTQSCDFNLAMAKAEVEFKEWLIKNNGGY